MKKPKLGLPPATPTPLANAAMQEMINKGGSTLETPAVKSEAEDDKLKSFTFKIYESELAQIRAILEPLPKRDRISIHDFVVAAVKEKITRQNKK